MKMEELAASQTVLECNPKSSCLILPSAEIAGGHKQASPASPGLANPANPPKSSSGDLDPISPRKVTALL